MWPKTAEDQEQALIASTLWSSRNARGVTGCGLRATGWRTGRCCAPTAHRRPVVADLFGLHPSTAETWAKYANDSWTHFLASSAATQGARTMKPPRTAGMDQAGAAVTSKAKIDQVYDRRLLTLSA